MRDLSPHRIVAVALVVAGCTTGGSADPAVEGTPAVPGATAPHKPALVNDTPAPPARTADPTNDPNAKPCSGTPGELYALSAKRLSANDDVPLCRFEGNVLLIVNTASHCGFTPEYGPLQALYDKYKAQGFYVLGFPSKSFNQEFDSAKDVSDFCTNEYKITFPMFAIANVNAPDQQPVYTWLKAQPGFDADIPWNFEKWIITRHGKVASRIAYQTSPDDPTVVAALEAELAKK